MGPAELNTGPCSKAVPPPAHHVIRGRGPQVATIASAFPRVLTVPDGVRGLLGRHSARGKATPSSFV